MWRGADYDPTVGTPSRINRYDFMLTWLVISVVFRALQGIGGSGIYSVVFVIVGKISTVEKIGLYTGILSSVFALACLLGPILGGVIIDNTTWRWVFFLK